MIYRDFQDLKLSLLGFGTMRLPLKEDGSVDEELTAKMTEYALQHGVNYIDTAWPYMNGTSEPIMGKILKNYPRESFYLATKYPGHQVFDVYDPADIFEKQLKRCQTDYFDFYLLHNVYENSIGVYKDSRWGIVDYFIEQKRQGRIRHLGFSSHGDLPCLKEFLDYCGEELEFCQIQLNYLDWTLQRAKEKYEFLTEKGIPVWVMEPVRGGKLAKLPEEDEAGLRAFRPEASTASFGFRWLQGLPNVKMVLSGMSDLEQMKDNIKSFENFDPLSEQEEKMLLEAAEHLKDSVPCTACRYCCEDCPMQLNIPDLLFKYNQLKVGSGNSVRMQLDALPEDKWPSACLACGACARVCPQKIDIPAELAAFAEALSKVTSWADVCKARAEAARKAAQAAAAEN